jgi:hypothetical protein
MGSKRQEHNINNLVFIALNFSGEKTWAGLDKLIQLSNQLYEYFAAVLSHNMNTMQVFLIYFAIYI